MLNELQAVAKTHHCPNNLYNSALSFLIFFCLILYFYQVLTLSSIFHIPLDYTVFSVADSPFSHTKNLCNLMMFIFLLQKKNRAKSIPLLWILLFSYKLFKKSYFFFCIPPHGLTVLWKMFKSLTINVAQNPWLMTQSIVLI